MWSNRGTLAAGVWLLDALWLVVALCSGVCVVDGVAGRPDEQAPVTSTTRRTKQVRNRMVSVWRARPAGPTAAAEMGVRGSSSLDV